MNIKESYQYKNHLASMVNEIKGWLFYEAYTTTKTRTHHYSEVNKDMDDATTNESKERPFAPYTPNDLIDFMIALLEEHSRLYKAINYAKIKAKDAWEGAIDIDPELAANKLRNEMIDYFKRMARIKPSQTIKTTGTAFKFNVEGNQVAYNYPIEDVTEIDFDRKNLLCVIKGLQETANEKSMRAERAMLNTALDFVAAFDVNDDTMDTLATFIENKKATSEAAVA